MPVVAIKVLELTQQADVSVAAIANVIQKDPALTAKLLQTANSPLFGLAKKVASVQQATVILGLRTVKVMALGFSLVDALQAAPIGDFDYQLYWRRSLTTAAVAKLIARHCRAVRADECFVGGLLADIGVLAAYHCIPDLYTPVVARCRTERQPIQDVEAPLLGTTHAAVSAGLLRKWSLPDVLCDAVEAHHGQVTAQLDARTQGLATLIHAAALLGELFCGDVDSGQLDAVKARCVQLVPIPPAALDQILDELHTAVDEMAALFRIEIGQSLSHETLRTQAMRQLAQISLAAEMDLAAAANRAAQAQHEIRQLSEKATTDSLTQLANRRVFDERLHQTFAQVQREAGAVGLIMVDLDHFKSLNDAYGHQAGDEALRQVGRCLKTVCAETAVAARYGGEEFAVILANATAQTLRDMAEEIRRNIEQIHFEHDRQPLRITASLGAAHVDLKFERTTPDELIGRADECLYDAKQNGRNRVEVTF